MTRTIVCTAIIALVATPCSRAAKLVVIAINSGHTPTSSTGVPSSDRPPIDPPGALGFLIGVDNTADPFAELRFDLTFSGSNLVQRLAPNSAAAEIIGSPNVQTRSDALIANGTYDPVPGSRFQDNDSWWWNAVQMIGSATLTLAPVSTGITGGGVGHAMSMIGDFNPSGKTPPGVWRMAYIVATGDVDISGVIASGQIGFGPAGNLSHTGGVARLDFETAQIVPEPSTLVLIGTALVGLAFRGLTQRRKWDTDAMRR